MINHKLIGTAIFLRMYLNLVLEFIMWINKKDTKLHVNGFLDRKDQDFLKKVQFNKINK